MYGLPFTKENSETGVCGRCKRIELLNKDGLCEECAIMVEIKAQNCDESEIEMDFDIEEVL